MDNSRFTVLFLPMGYSVRDINNDNMDIIVLFENGQRYAATIFTIENVRSLMGAGNYFWALTMIIVKDLAKETIFNTISELIERFGIKNVMMELEPFLSDVSLLNFDVPDREIDAAYYYSLPKLTD